MALFEGIETWRIFHGLFLIAALFSVVGTWIVSTIILRIYRGRVHREMSRTMHDAPAPSAVPPRPPQHGAPSITVHSPGQSVDTATLRAARRSAHRAQLIFGLAGLIYGIAATCVLFAFDGIDFLPVRTTVLILLHAWPVVPAVLAQTLGVRPTRVALVWAVYFSVIGALLMVAGGLSVGETVFIVADIVFLPAAFIAATSARTVRGAAWLVAPGLLLLGLAGMQLIFPLFYLILGVSPDRYAFVLMLGGAVCLSILGIYGFGLLSAYRAKVVSDQTLLVLQWWFVAAVWFTADLVAAHGPIAVLGLLPLVLMCLFLVAAHRLASRSVGPPTRLLLLRTFGSRGRSTRLLRSLTRHWRWIGSVELVAAPDIATEVLDPDEFVDFLRGRLAQRFVTGRSALQRQLEGLDLTPDGDRRYRVNEFLCHIDNWKPVVEALIGAVDAIMIDLRGFNNEHLGVVHEIERIVALVDLDRVIAIVDDSTDPNALQWALDYASANSPESAPLRHNGSRVLQIVAGQKSAWQDTRPMVQATFQAASHRVVASS